jgi:hypothetical protein
MADRIRVTFRLGEDSVTTEFPVFATIRAVISGGRLRGIEDAPPRPGEYRITSTTGPKEEKE